MRPKAKGFSEDDVCARCGRQLRAHRTWECPDEQGTFTPVPPQAPLEQGWQPIETAPECQKVWVTWVNALGKRRTAFASYWPEGALDMSDDVPDYQQNDEGKNLDAGWWEESEGNDDAMFRLVEQMTHWMPPPPPPALPTAAALVPPQAPNEKEQT